MENFTNFKSMVGFSCNKVPDGENLKKVQLPFPVEEISYFSVGLNRMMLYNMESFSVFGFMDAG